MCGRYYLEREIAGEELRQIIDAVNRRTAEQPVKTEGEIFPADVVPVLANSRAQAPSVYAMAWGYRLPNGKRLINARSETAADKPLFREGMLRRRCLIPASNYFEWERRGKAKTKYAIRPARDGLAYLAGIYRLEAGQPVFTILTREPAAPIAFIHDRMPVLLPRERIADWLNPDLDAAKLLEDAIVDVTYQKAPSPEPEQLRMW